MATKRIHNSKSNTYFKIRQRTTKAGRKGQIMGKWSPSSDTKSVKSAVDYAFSKYGDVLTRLSDG